MQEPELDRTSLVKFAQFNNWANQHLLEVARRLDEAALREPSSFFDHGTAFKSLLHLLDVEWSWLNAARGHDMTAYLWDVEPLPDLAAIRAFAERFATELETYVAGLRAEELAELVDVGTAQGRSPAWVRRLDILIHLINHGTAHRSELAHFLTSQGHSPGEIDYMDYALKASR